VDAASPLRRQAVVRKRSWGRTDQGLYEAKARGRNCVPRSEPPVEWKEVRGLSGFSLANTPGHILRDQKGQEIQSIGWPNARNADCKIVTDHPGRIIKFGDSIHLIADG
jgi:hypothetical protein